LEPRFGEAIAGGCASALLSKMLPSIGREGCCVRKSAYTSKLEIAIIAAALVVLTIEGRHESRNGDRMQATEAAIGSHAQCPASDGVPYSPECLVFMEGEPRPTARVGAQKDRPMGRHTHDGNLASGGCPETDNVPYPPSCLRYLSGWFWHAPDVGAL
jgi:hypothetical protein